MEVDNISRGTQADRVLTLFTDNPTLLYGASQVWGLVFRGEQVPLTSVRRALSNLDHAGLIVQTSAVRSGLFRRYEHLYQLGSTVL